MDIVGISEKEQVSLCKQLLNLNFVFFSFILTVNFSFCLYQQEAIFRVVAAILHIGKSSLLRERKWIHQFLRMIRRSFISRQQQNFSCT